MTNTLRITAVFGAVALLAVGCKKTDDNKTNFSNAINAYYAAHPACLWDEPIKFPVQVTTSDTDKTRGYDALVDQGLLQRTTAEKKVFIVGSKEVTNYDISDKGRSSWTADTDNPGFGNFCYGHRSVQWIDSATASSDQPGATTQVVYHYALSPAPSWASAPETQNAFPRVRVDLAAPQTANATLMNTSNGWQMQAIVGVKRPATDADAKIVE